MSSVQVEARTLWPSAIACLMDATKYINPRETAEAAFFLAEILSLIDEGVSILKRVQED